jgi:predicted Zn-ribbon and HTH transcriptional regulator
MSKKKTEKDYHDLAKSCGFKWVGSVLPRYVKDPTLWECEKGDKWKTTYNSIQQGSGCPSCSGNAKKTEQDYYGLAKNRGFKWVGRVLPNNTKCLTLWECKRCGCVWEVRYDNIGNGSGCPSCSGNAKKTEKDYYDLAEYREFEWVGWVLPKNIKDITLWECKKCKYIWKARYNDIQQGSGCPDCSGKARKTEEDYHKLADSRGFKWVGVVLPKDNKYPTLWECEKGHRWEAWYSNVRRGTGCPTCRDMINGAPVSKPQRKLNNLLCGSLNYPEEKYRIDVAIMRKSQKIAVEYDCYYWHAGNEEYDAKRDMFLVSCGWKVLHIKSGELLPTRKQMNIAIKHLLDTNDVLHNLYLRDWKN